MKNQVIEALTPEHGKKVIKYWQSQGVDTRRLKGSISAANGGVFRYYGVIDGKFANYSLCKVEASGAEIIELPDDNSDACEMQENLNQVKMKCSYKGALSVVPDPIVYKMLEYQVLQGNPRDVSVFEMSRIAGVSSGGFNWFDTPEGYYFWNEVLEGKNFDTFFMQYPELMPETDTSDIQAALNRIESKLDQLLTEETKPKVLTVKDFKPGDRVRVKTWKEIKAMTVKDADGDRHYAGGGVFLRSEKPACGKTGEVISNVMHGYVSVIGEGWEYRLASKSLEKI